jgi:hypothetical protein
VLGGCDQGLAVIGGRNAQAVERRLRFHVPASAASTACENFMIEVAVAEVQPRLLQVAPEAVVPDYLASKKPVAKGVAAA